MTVNIITVPRFTGPVGPTEVPVPGSKSIANRALVCTALATGVSRLENLPDGDDTTAMISCLRQLGVRTQADHTALTVHGSEGSKVVPGTTLHAGLAGTTSRFTAAIAALSGSPIVLDGDAALRSRPFGPLFDALRELGATIEHHGDAAEGETEDGLPVRITGPLSADRVSIRGDISSQFVTALMLVAPVLPSGLTIELTSALVSRPYVDMTAAVMSAFGSATVEVSATRIVVPPGGYHATTYGIEPDASSASYPLAIVAINGGTVTVPGLTSTSLQGDARFVELLAAMGCSVTQRADGVQVARDSATRLQGIEVDMADISDLVPTMAAVAAVADTPTTIDGVGFIRRKESDRIGDLTREMRRLGVDIDEHPEGLTIRPSADRLRPARVSTHHDHRLAMAFAVLGTRIGGVEIDDPDVVSKSWPSFWSMLERLQPH